MPIDYSHIKSRLVAHEENCLAYFFFIGFMGRRHIGSQYKLPTYATPEQRSTYLQGSHAAITKITNYDVAQSIPSKLRIAQEFLRGDTVGTLGSKIRAEYENQYTCFEANKAKNQPETPMSKSSQLYQVKGTDTFGTIVGTNSDGLKILQVGDTYQPHPASALERVMPYTVDLVFAGSAAHQYSYKCKKGAVKVGQFVLVEGESTYFKIAVVSAVDTKSEAATAWLKGWQLQTKPFDTAPEGGE